MFATCIFVINTLAFTIFTTVNAAPWTLDTSSLLQNAQEAQTLNSEFTDLSLSDSCTAGQTACISGGVAICVTDGTWQIANDCQQRDLSCFALPSTRKNGTALSCTSEKTALSVISAAGANGGIFANQTSSNSNSSATNTASGNTGAVTVTVTLIPGSTATLEPTTRTISPAEASALLSSLAGPSATTIPTAGQDNASAPSPTSSPVNYIKSPNGVTDIKYASIITLLPARPSS